MSIDMQKLYSDFSIDYVSYGEHKHARDGYINTPCPFCSGNDGYHLSWNVDESYFVCWRCGWKPPIKAVSVLLKMPYGQAEDLIKQYGNVRSKTKRVEKGKKPFKLPTFLEELIPAHKKYLRARGFDPFELETVWGVQSTSPISELDGISYSHRVLIPFMWHLQMVSFDTRDVTGKHQNKYQACPKVRELIEHKQILYGNQEAWGGTGIVVEGPIDVWGIGELGAGTSGIKFTPAQVREIARSFKRVAVVYDGEIQAQKQARLLVAELRFRGINAMNFKLNGTNDPGDLTSKEAKELVNNIKRKLK